MPNDFSAFDWNWRRRPLFWLAVLVAAILAVWKPDFVASHDISRLISPTPQTVYIAGVVDSEVDVRESDFGAETSSFELRARRFWKDSGDEGQVVSGRVRVSMPAKAEIHYGDLIAFSGQLRSPRGLRNPGGFNQKAWLARQGIRSLFYSGKEDRLQILEKNRANPAYAKILQFKAASLAKLHQSYSERDAALLSALFFGTRSDIDDDVKDSFFKTGTLHLLAVSGFNVGFVIAAALILLKPFRIRRQIGLALALAAAWFYVLLVGPQSPVFRAGVMATVWLSGEILGRRSDALNSLGLSALILWALRPLELFDPGFQLSYAAVIGIVVAVPRLAPRPFLLPNEKMSFEEKVSREVSLLFWTSFAAQVATLPITSAHFYVVTPWSVLANVPAGFLVLVIFMSGAIQLFLSFTVPFLASLMAWVVKTLLALLLGILSGFERLPFAIWVAGKLTLVIWLVLTVACCIFIFSKRGRRAWRVGVFAAVAALCFGAQEICRATDHSFRVTFLDVGQGDAMDLRFPNGSHWLVDAGQGRSPDRGRTVLVPYFRHEGVRQLEQVVISHPQEDHVGGLESVLGEIPTKRYLDPGAPYDSARYRHLLEFLKKRRVPVAAAHAGESWEVAGVHAEVLAAGSIEGKDINDASVILLLRYVGETLLLTGDAGESAFARLASIPPIGSVTVLKAPHHGAKPGPEEKAYLAQIVPRVSVISSGERNRYGHPSAEALATLEAIQGNQIYRTDRSGAIRVVFEKDGIRVLDGPEAFA